MKFLLYSCIAATLLSAEPQPQPATAPKARSVSTVFSSTSPNASYVGVFVAEIDGERMKKLKLNEERGVEVTKVEDESPAAKAGIKTGDVILDYNGQRVEGIEQFRRFVRETPPNRDVKVGIVREGGPQTITVKVGARKLTALEPMISMAGPRMEALPEIRMPAMASVKPGMVFWSSSALGIEAEAVDGQLAAFFGVKEGVLVRNVAKGSTAEKSGLKAGDVISKVEDTAVSSPSELTRAVRTSRQSKKTFPLTVTRDKREMTVTVNVEDGDRSGWPQIPAEGFRMPVGRIITL